jgi:hypothetical protein
MPKKIEAKLLTGFEFLRHPDSLLLVFYISELSAKICGSQAVVS